MKNKVSLISIIFIFTLLIARSSRGIRNSENSEDLISPEEGEYLNYSHCGYSDDGMLAYNTTWNVTFDNYLEPHLINVTMDIGEPHPDAGTYWLTVNTSTRVVVEDGDLWWDSNYFTMWIQPNVDIGDTISICTSFLRKKKEVLSV